MEQTAPKTKASDDKTGRAKKLAEEIKEHMSRGDYAGALKSIDAILEILPDDHEILITKVQLLIFFNKLRDADKLIDNVIEKFPKDPYAYLTKAIITVLYTSNIKDAISHLDKGIETCPECFELIVAKAQMLYWLGDSSYNLWIERAEHINPERAKIFLKKYWVEKLETPASYPAAQLHGLISNILFLISQQKYNGRK